MFLIKKQLVAGSYIHEIHENDDAQIFVFIVSDFIDKYAWFL